MSIRTKTITAWHLKLVASLMKYHMKYILEILTNNWANSFISPCLWIWIWNWMLHWSLSLWHQIGVCCKTVMNPDWSEYDKSRWLPSRLKPTRKGLLTICQVSKEISHANWNYNNGIKCIFNAKRYIREYFFNILTFLWIILQLK